MSLITTYNPLPIAFTHGSGSFLFDESGISYLDTFSGIAVCGLGHAHPDVTKTIQMQAAKLLHTSNAFQIEAQMTLAAMLTKKTRMQQVFFGNSGAEANEAAIKLARLYGHQRDIAVPTIIVMEQAFHGRTLATLSASGSRKNQAGFEPLVTGFARAPFNNLAAIERIAEHRDDIVAVLVEPIQGESGVHVADPHYLQGLAALCARKEWLLMLDEVQTGNGRLGSLYACMGQDITPDVLTTAKGLGNGVPIGACLMHGRAKDLFQPGNHGSTFGGNPFVCTVASTVLEVIERDQLCERAQSRGVQLKQALVDTLSAHPLVKAIRGDGLMLGVELTVPAAPIKMIGLKHHVLWNVTSETVVRLLPALNMSDDELALLVTQLKICLDALLDDMKNGC
jgi:acetylornithine/N-succinyldiaminopimelate aminotransferase